MCCLLWAPVLEAEHLLLQEVHPGPERNSLPTAASCQSVWEKTTHILLKEIYEVKTFVVKYYFS